MTTPASFAPGPLTSLGKMRDAAAAASRASPSSKNRNGMRKLLSLFFSLALRRETFRSSEYTSTPPKFSLLSANEKNKDKSLRIPLRFFDEGEALLAAAAASRIFPSDVSGPGAKEAGVVIYIDRQLAGPYGKDRYRYTQPPFEKGLPEQGYQDAATPRDIYREGLKPLAGFNRRDTAEQDKILTGIESTVFFSLLRTHTIEGM